MEYYFYRIIGLETDINISYISLNIENKQKMFRFKRNTLLLSLKKCMERYFHTI